MGWRRRRSGETVNGYDDVVQQDGSLTPISIEAKAWDKLQLRQAWIDQAMENAGGRPWMVVQRPKGSRTIYATMDMNTVVWLCQAAGLIANQQEGS